MFTTRFTRLARAIRNANRKPNLGRPFEVLRAQAHTAPRLYNPSRDLDGMEHAAALRAQAVNLRKLQGCRT